MTDQSTESTSRLEAAYNEQSGGEWYRSPLVLLAGLILFAGALALVVVSLTGGDDGDEVVSGEAPVAADEGVPDTSQPAAADEPAPELSFGGEGVEEVGVVTLMGEALPPLIPGEEDTALGLRAPDAQVSSLANGAPLTLGPGRARVIGFFAHWCPHCQDELPVVAEWLADNQLPQNVEFIAVSTSVNADQDNYPPSDWFRDVGWPAPVVVDDAKGSLLQGYGFGGFPAFIAIDANGTVVGRTSGNIGIDGLNALVDQFAG